MYGGLHEENETVPSLCRVRLWVSKEQKNYGKMVLRAGSSGAVAKPVSQAIIRNTHEQPSINLDLLSFYLTV